MTNSDRHRDLGLVTSYYDARAATYDDDHTTPYQGALIGIWRSLLIRSTRGRDHETLLDLGCGTGYLTSLFAGLIGAKVAIGIDCAAGMLKRHRSGHEGSAELVWKVGDIHQLPIEDETVDVVVSSRGSLIYCDLKRVLSEAFRVLRPGGCFVADINNRHSFETLFHVTARERSLRAALDHWRYGRNPRLGLRGVVPAEEHPSPSEVEEALAVVGFECERLFSFPIALRFFAQANKKGSRTKPPMRAVVCFDRWIARLPFINRFGNVVFAAATKPWRPS